MTNESDENRSAWGRIVGVVLGLPWLDVIPDLWKVLIRRPLQRLVNTGMYEVLEYKSMLEILDESGNLARVHKRQKIRYLQDNIIAYQDQAWGDGESLMNYKCSPGKAVDRYKVGSTTQILISLQETKNRGDVDVFDIQWDVKDSLVLNTEQWSTTISHETDQLRTQVIFPASRPPRRVRLIEYSRRRSRLLKQSAIRQLADGRYVARWEKRNPRLHEQYIIQWDW